MYALIIIISTIGPGNIGNQLSASHLQAGRYSTFEECDKAAKTAKVSNIIPVNKDADKKFDTMVAFICLNTGAKN